MQNENGLWEKWALSLRHWGLDQFAAFLLDAGAPLTILATQFIYLAQPFIRQSIPENQFKAMVNLFEDQQEGEMFASFLREGKKL